MTTKYDLSKKNKAKGVFLVSAKNAFLPVKRDHSVSTYSRTSTVSQGSEQSESVNGASEASIAKWSFTEQVSGV